ncbi:hypothetical protein AG4045_010231 [Apium graveolens]|uniref:Uncharacterized protein n=1 Tax=Apium graveolens TaxID=4045 RepID=A0A6L5B6K7_APIGR|nr:hypothetical protein AG4045_010231 [Apium graveolens]
MISDYNVKHALRTCRPVPGQYIVKFHRRMIVKEVDDGANIPMLIFELKIFQDARATLGDCDSHGNDTIKISLWENQACEFMNWETEIHDLHGLKHYISETLQEN